MTARDGGAARITARVDLGTAELVPDPHHPAGWTLLIDDVPQSYVDLDDPTHLEFEYVRRTAAVIDTAAPPGVPLRVLHLGGGALSLPRYIAATRPGSVQRVLEPDRALVELVRRELPLPRTARVRITPADARAGLTAIAANGARFDLMIGDVYRGARMPGSVASIEFARLAAEVLEPAGRYAVNVADLPPLAFTRRQTATLRAAFADVCVVAEPGMLRGRRYGNLVLVAAVQAQGLDIVRLTRAGLRDPFPSRVLHGADLDDFVGGARPVTDAVARDSPAPPPALLR